MNDLQPLMNHIETVWGCSPERYPALQGMNPEQQKNFVAAHTVLHIAKTQGKIAAVAEAFDHRGKASEGDTAALQIAACQLFATALNLASHVGLNAPALIARTFHHAS